MIVMKYLILIHLINKSIKNKPNICVKSDLAKSLPNRLYKAFDCDKMKKININLNPGIYLLIMIWWIFVSFIGTIVRHSIFDYLSSFIPYFLAFFIFGLSAILLGVYEIKNYFWDKCGYWKKYFIIIGLYAAATIICVSVTVILDDYRLVQYFEGDAAGSFGMGYFGFLSLYLIVGVVIGVVSSLYNRKSNKPLN